jgi:hypothetical protein
VPTRRWHAVRCRNRRRYGSSEEGFNKTNVYVTFERELDSSFRAHEVIVQPSLRSLVMRDQFETLHLRVQVPRTALLEGGPNKSEYSRMAAPNYNPWKEDTLPLSQKELRGRAQGNSRGSSSTNSLPLSTEVNYCVPSSSSSNYNVEESMPPGNEIYNITGSTRYDTPYTTASPATSDLPQTHNPYLSGPQVEGISHGVLRSSGSAPPGVLPYYRNIPQEQFNTKDANTFSPEYPQPQQHTDLIRQLSDLSNRLSEQIKNIRTENWTQCLSSLFDTGSSQESEGDRTLRDIHSSSELFLEIISHLKASSLRTPTTPTQESYQPSTQFETSTVLLLITCYLRSINIYHALFSQIHRYLISTSTSQSKPASASTFSRTSTPGYSPQSYGKLQATIFVEVSVQIINRFDIAIGIPPQHRLTNAATVESGILEEEASSALLEVILSRTAAEGDGGMRALSEVIAKVKGLLGCAEMDRIPVSVDIE